MKPLDNVTNDTHSVQLFVVEFDTCLFWELLLLPSNAQTWPLWRATDGDTGEEWFQLFECLPLFIVTLTPNPDGVTTSERGCILHLLANRLCARVGHLGGAGGVPTTNLSLSWDCPHPPIKHTCFARTCRIEGRKQMSALKHDSKIFRQSSNLVCGLSMLEEAWLCPVWPSENWLCSSWNHIQDWVTVCRSYSRALEQALLEGRIWVEGGREGGRRRTALL